MPRTSAGPAGTKGRVKRPLESLRVTYTALSSPARGTTACTSASRITCPEAQSNTTPRTCVSGMGPPVLNTIVRAESRRLLLRSVTPGSSVTA